MNNFSALRPNSDAGAIISLVGKCMSNPSALEKLNAAFGEDMFSDWLIQEAANRSLLTEDCRKSQLPYDFVINGHRVQAKCRAGKGGYVDCRPVAAYKSRQGVRRYPASAIDVMAIGIISSLEFFLVPAESFRCPKYPGFLRNSFSSKKYPEYKDAWHVLTGEKGSQPAQMPLLFS